jgi:HAL2 family 3'(2'),5'-bisphosphate nucleotidase
VEERLRCLVSTLLTSSLNAATAAVSLAAVVCRRVQAELDVVRAITKDDASPVTVADFASQAIVAHVLTERLGVRVRLVAEESSAFLRDPSHVAHLHAALDAARLVLPSLNESRLLSLIDVGAGEPDVQAGFWTLDPIDGTKGFLRGGQYAVALGYIEDGTVRLGAMACPNLTSDLAPLLPQGATGCVIAARASGAHDHGSCEAHIESEVGSQVVPIPCRGPVGVGAPARLAESVESSHTSHDIAASVMHAAGPVRDAVRLDSQCKYACVAMGGADAYLRMPSRKGYIERIWDHAAGSIIAEQAGCVVTDVRGTPLDFAHGRGLESNRGIVCAASDLHQRLIAALAERGVQ